MAVSARPECWVPVFVSFVALLLARLLITVKTSPTLVLKPQMNLHSPIPLRMDNCHRLPTQLLLCSPNCASFHEWRSALSGCRSSLKKVAELITVGSMLRVGGAHIHVSSSSSSARTFILAVPANQDVICWKELLTTMKVRYTRHLASNRARYYARFHGFRNVRNWRA